MKFLKITGGRVERTLKLSTRDPQLIAAFILEARPTIVKLQQAFAQLSEGRDSERIFGEIDCLETILSEIARRHRFECAGHAIGCRKVA